MPRLGGYLGIDSFNDQRQLYYSIANFGLRPTLADHQPEPRWEVHLLNFTGNLYGCELNFAIIDFLRDEEKFLDLKTLAGQIKRDVAQAQALANSLAVLN